MSTSVDDAVALLRDPTYVTIDGQRAELRADGLVEMGSRILNELQARGAESVECALGLVREALEIVGGQDASYWIESRQTGGVRPTPPPQRAYAFRVPIGALSDATAS